MIMGFSTDPFGLAIVGVENAGVFVELGIVGVEVGDMTSAEQPLADKALKRIIDNKR